MRLRILMVFTLAASLTLGLSSGAFAHPGRTDSSGGHTCRTNCPKWGLRYGQYHYHNSGSSSSGSGRSSSGSSGSSGSGSGSSLLYTPQPQTVTAAPPTFGVEAAEWTIRINGSAVAFSKAPRQNGGEVLVPAQEFLTALGASFFPGHTAVAMDAKRGALKVGVAGDSKVGWANDLEFPLQTPTFMYKGTLYAPLRFLSEALGGWFTINTDQHTIDITLEAGDRPEHFPVGASQLWVSAVMGSPLKVNNLWRYGGSAPNSAYKFGQPGARYWEYGKGSVIEFDDTGHVAGWNNVDGALKAFVADPVAGATFGVGSTKHEVALAKGTPTQLTYWFWRYDGLVIRFDEAQRVSGVEIQIDGLN